MIIDPRGMNIEDVKNLLIENEQVISLEDNAKLLKDYCTLLGICLEANTGNEKAKIYLEDEVVRRFESFIPNEYHDIVLKETNDFLEPIEN